MNKEITYKGFNFVPLDASQNNTKNNWVAIKTIEAANSSVAINTFRNDLDDVINKLTFFTQSYFLFTAEKFLIYKQNNNIENVFEFIHGKDIIPIGISFDEKDIKDLEKMENVISAFFNFMANSNLSMTGNSRILLLISALECLAGKDKTPGKCSNCKVPYPNNKTNEDKLKEILGEVLFYKFYKNGGPKYRNEVVHGNKISQELLNSLNEGLYEAIRKYVKIQYNINGMTAITDAPRSPFFYKLESLFLKRNDKYKPSLIDIEKIKVNPLGQSYTQVVKPVEY